MDENQLHRSGRNASRRKSNYSSSSTLLTLMYSIFGAFTLMFTFLAGRHDCQSFDSPVLRGIRGNNSANIATSLDSVPTNDIANNDVFIPTRNRKNDTAKKKETNIRQDVYGKPIVRPADWEDWKFGDIHHGFKCGEHAKDQDKPLPDMDYWNYMRGIFRKVVDPNAAFDDPILPTEGYTMDENGKQPYYAKKSPGKGRGLFASRDIKKGEVVHDGTDSDTTFPMGMDYRRFLFTLPQKMACDSTEWTWTQQMKEDGPYVIRTAFNISVLMNSSKDPNAMPPNSYSSKFFALRDIKKDEEILTDYKIYPTKYKLFGM